MGIHDRDYFRGETSLQIGSRSVVLTLIILNIALFVLQVLFGQALQDALVLRAADLFGGSFPEFWRLLTANFAHANGWHLFGNMLLLFVFGRELEEIYGRKNLATLYLAAGAIALLAEAGVQQIDGKPGIAILGASGAVMAIVALYAILFPRRVVLLFGIIPLQVWMLCTIIIGLDVLGFLGRSHSNTAHMAHLAGVAVGFLYHRFDLRWERVLRWRRHRRERSSKSRGSVISIRPRRDVERRPPPPDPDPVSERIDLLLAKISERGFEGLSDEERAFLAENAQNYRSR